MKKHIIFNKGLYLNFILTLIIILVAFNKLSAFEKDSTENVEPKPRYVGIILGTNIPEALHIGLSARLTRGIYFSYKYGKFPGIFKDIHSGEITFYLRKENELKYFESSYWNFSLAYTVMPDDQDMFALRKKISDQINYSARIGYDIYLTKNLVFQTGLGIGISYREDESSDKFILPAVKLNLLYWIK